jgi:hypothetical protein
VDKVALYEYNTQGLIMERPDVLNFGYNHGTVLYEIKMSLSDFNREKYKNCRKIYKPSYSLQIVDKIISDQIGGHIIENNKQLHRKFLKLKEEFPHIFLKETLHLGNFRYYVCPADVIPVEKLPEGWGLYYFKGGRFFLQKEARAFRSNLRSENYLLIHAMRRYASGDKTGIIANSYCYFGGKE